MKNKLRVVIALIFASLLANTLAWAENIKPTLRIREKPVYPPDLYIKGISGTVTVEFVIDTEGNVIEAHVTPESESELWQFKYSAVVCIWQCKFNPGIRDGIPVMTRLRMPIYYNKQKQETSVNP